MALSDPFDPYGGEAPAPRPNQWRFPGQEPVFQGGPPVGPVRLDEGAGGPCPPGQSRGGHPGNPCRARPNYNPGGRGAAPAGGGAPRPGGLTAPGAPSAGGPGMDDMSSTIWSRITDALNGFDGPTLDRMKGQVFSAAQGRSAADINSMNEDLTSRGLARSGIAAEGAMNIRNTASQNYTQGVTQIQIRNVEFKMAALDKAQKHLDSLRDYLISRESNANQREIGLAQIKLGYAKIDAERENLKLSLASRGGGGGGGGNDPFEQFMRLAGAQF